MTIEHGIAIKTLDQAGGDQLNTTQHRVYYEEGGTEYELIVKGDPVEGHGPAPHASPVMAEGSSLFLIEVDGKEIPVCREGHLATCGHPTTGRSRWFIQE